MFRILHIGVYLGATARWASRFMSVIAGEAHELWTPKRTGTEH